MLQPSNNDINYTTSVLNLLTEYQKLNRAVVTENRLYIEKRKLQIIQLVEFKLKQDLQLFLNVDTQEEIPHSMWGLGSNGTANRLKDFLSL